MKLHSLHLQNFRVHADTRVDFPAEGVIGVVGANESGKSTILEAISWALFGSRATRGTVGSLRWNRAPARHIASAELAFEVGGTRYRLERTENDAKLFEDGSAEPIAAGISAVDEYVPGLLGMSLEEFSATYLARQKDLDRLADMGGTERRQFFLRVMGVGRIDEALSAARSRKNDLAREVDGLRAGLGEREPLATELEEATADETAKAEAFLNAGSRLQEAEAELERAEAALEGLQELADRHERLEREVGAAELYARQAGDELERAERKIEAHGPVDFAPERLAEGERRLREIEAKLEDLRERDRKLAKERQQKVQDARVELGTMERQGKELRARLRRLGELGSDGECPTCMQPLGDRYEQVVAGIQRQLEAVRESYARQQKVAERASTKTDEEMQLEIAIEAEGTDRDLLSEQLEGLREKKRAADRLQELREEAERWSEKATSWKEKERKAREALAALEFDPEAYQAADQAAREAREAAAAARETRARAEVELRSARDRLARAEKQLEAYDARAERLGELEADLRTHQRAADRLNEFRAEMAAGIRPEMEELASGFVQILTDGRHEGMVLTDDFEARLLEGGLETEVVSGGTQDIAAIALRLAVSQMIAERAGHPLSLLVLDEPFGSLDAVRRENVLTLIRRLSSVFDQTILITHVEEAKDTVDHAVFVEFDESEGRARVQQLGAVEAAA